MVSSTRKEAYDERFVYLTELARKIGASEAKILSSNDVVVENRVVLKCQTGCHMYGHKLVCPPYTPTPDEFRKILNEYRSVLVIKFPTEAEACEDVGRSLLRNLYGPETPSDVKDQTRRFWDAWSEDKRRSLQKMLELEKAAFNGGFTLALALTPGSCTLCETCNIDGTCIHPTMARYPEHALGVNVSKTLKNAGMTIKFPFEQKPEAVGILLID